MTDAQKGTVEQSPTHELCIETTSNTGIATITTSKDAPIQNVHGGETTMQDEPSQDASTEDHACAAIGHAVWIR